jgi:hypothetical protein
MDFKNFAYGTVATAPSPATSGTSVVLGSGQGALFPTSFPYSVVIWPTGVNPTSSNAEIVTVTGISTDTLTIVRAQEGTSARTVVTGDQIMYAITGELLRRLEGDWSITVAQRTLSSVNTAQDVFDAGQNSITLEANMLYEIEAVYDIRTGTTSHSTGILFGGTVGINFIKLHNRGFKGGANATVTATNGGMKTALANLVITPANTTANSQVWYKGIIATTTSGTLIPQIQFSAGPAGTNTMEVGSWVRIKKLGPSSSGVIGGWN